MNELRPTPSQPVFYGQIHFGAFRTPFETLNLIDADIYGHHWAPRWWRNLRLKEWQHVGIIHDDVYCGFAIFDAKFMAVSFFYVFDRHTRKIIEHKRTTLQRGAIQVPDQLWHGDGFFRQPGYRICMENRLRSGEHALTISITDPPAVCGTFTVFENLQRCQPLIAVLPVNDYRRPLYTHKAACPVEGELRIGDQSYILDPTRDWVLIDVQKTFYPHNAFWKWVTFAGRDQDSTPVAVNLTQNMIRDDTTWNECCAWVDGRLVRLGAARFDYDPGALLAPWTVTTSCGRISLTFAPEGERADQINVAGLIRSDFHQPFGTYSGVIVDDAQQQHIVDGVFGVAEHHILRA